MQQCFAGPKQKKAALVSLFLTQHFGAKLIFTKNINDRTYS